MRPIQFLIAGLASLFIAETAMADRTDAPTEIVQSLLRDDRLVEYFHLDMRPGPIPFVNRSDQPVQADRLDVEGRPVSTDGAGAETAFVIESLSQTDGTAQLSFRYRVEGLSGTAGFSAGSDGKWTLETLDLKEN